MRPQLLALAILVAALQAGDASHLLPARLARRQSGEGERESTSAKAQEGAQQAPPASSQQQPRLYPDLPRQPNFLPPFNAPPGNGFQPPSLVPFGMQLPPTNRLNADQQPLPYGRMPPQPRPMSAAERLQSQSFASGLGRRLLSMIGIEPDAGKAGAQPVAAASTDPQAAAGQGAGQGAEGAAAAALQNATVLQQLNRGVHSIYGGLSRMYNSTVQQQLELLQQRLSAETANSTNPWHQRMAQQVPAYFRQVAARVGEAQEQLNRVWRDLSQGNSSMLSRQDGERPRSFFASFDHFLSDPTAGGGGGGGDFLTRTFADNSGNSGPPGASNQTAGQRDIAGKLRELWHTQVEPELMNIRGQVSRVWRDLMANGAVAQEPVFRTRQGGLGAGASAGGANGSAAELVDSILKEVDVSSPEYTLIEPKGEGEAGGAAASSRQEQGASAPGQPQEGGVKLSPQMQARMVELQSELNRLWMGLTSSLQSAVANVRRSVSPQPQFEMMNPAAAGQPAPADAQQSEISDRIKDLAKVQRDADLVRAALDQQQRETQQRQSLGDRFRGLFEGVDMRGINQLPDRIGEQFNRFGNAVGNFWNRLPERWDNFMANQRQPQGPPMSSRLQAGATSATSTTSSETPSAK